MSAGTENTHTQISKVSRFVSCNSRLKLDHTVQSGCDYSRERKGKMAKEFQKKQFPLPMWRMCCPTVLPFTSDVTLRLLSQWPPLKSNFPSWDTTNRWAVTSTTGENGPARNLWVLHTRERERAGEWEREGEREKERERESERWWVGYFQESAGQLQYKQDVRMLTVRETHFTPATVGSLMKVK